jgi:uncharacterized protein YgfB (UPF0149 family)
MDPELLSKALAASELIAPAELHGMVCGLASAHPGTFSIPEFVDLVGTDVLTDGSATEDFVSATLDQLHAQDMEFHPLVPDDEEHLAHRIEGTASWCAAFLSGFGAGVAELGVLSGALPEDVQEILRDFVSLSGMDEGDTQATNGDEASFMEIYEYVRVASVLVHTLMQEVSEAEGGAEPLH